MQPERKGRMEDSDEGIGGSTLLRGEDVGNGSGWREETGEDLSHEFKITSTPINQTEAGTWNREMQASTQPDIIQMMSKFMDEQNRIAEEQSKFMEELYKKREERMREFVKELAEEQNKREEEWDKREEERTRELANQISQVVARFERQDRKPETLANKMEEERETRLQEQINDHLGTQDNNMGEMEVRCQEDVKANENKIEEYQMEIPDKLREVEDKVVPLESREENMKLEESVVKRDPITDETREMSNAVPINTIQTVTYNDQPWQRRKSSDVRIRKCPTIRLMCEGMSTGALVDTGCTITVVSEKFDEELLAEGKKMRCLPMNGAYVIGATQKRSSPITKQIMINVEIGNQRYEVVALVLKNLLRPIILGTEFLLECRVAIDLDRKLAELGGQKAEMDQGLEEGYEVCSGNVVEESEEKLWEQVKQIGILGNRQVFSKNQAPIKDYKVKCFKEGRIQEDDPDIAALRRKRDRWKIVDGVVLVKIQDRQEIVGCYNFYNLRPCPIEGGDLEDPTQKFRWILCEKSGKRGGGGDETNCYHLSDNNAFRPSS